jgi:predicted double-glycine peptidase
VKIQINDLTNQVYAPVTDQTTKDQALNKLGDAMTKLTTVQRDIDQTRLTLQDLEAKATAAAAGRSKEIALRPKA